MDKEITLGVIIPRTLSHTPDDMEQQQLEEYYIQPVYRVVNHSPTEHSQNMELQKPPIGTKMEIALQLVLLAKLHSDVLQCLHEETLLTSWGREDAMPVEGMVLLSGLC